MAGECQSFCQRQPQSLIAEKAMNQQDRDLLRRRSGIGRGERALMQQRLRDAEGSERVDGFAYPCAQPQPQALQEPGVRALCANGPGQHKIETQHERMNRQRHQYADQNGQWCRKSPRQGKPDRHHQGQQQLSDQHRQLNSRDHGGFVNNAAIIGRF